MKTDQLSTEVTVLFGDQYETVKRVAKILGTMGLDVVVTSPRALMYGVTIFTTVERSRNALDLFNEASDQVRFP